MAQMVASSANHAQVGGTVCRSQCSGVKRRHGPQSYTYDEGLFACEELLMVCGVQLEEFD